MTRQFYKKDNLPFEFEGVSYTIKIKEVVDVIIKNTGSNRN